MSRAPTDRPLPFGPAAAAALAALLVGGCGGSEPPTPAPGLEKITTQTGVEMVLLPAGDFLMGDEGGEEDEKPARKVTISGFYMDTCEVTQKSFQDLMGRSPSKFAGPDRPVERVSWLSAVQYCNQRSLKEGFKPCYDPKTLLCDFSADGYRLPTEAEWEYACRAGARTRYSFGDDPAALGTAAWYKGNSEKTTHPVRRKAPNAWGLYDMHGNVAEWCNDVYLPRAYAAASARDWRGPGEGRPSGSPGEERVLRGGSWASPAGACRSSARASEPPGFADVCFGYEMYGFRCVRSAPRESVSR